jgi:hypothetical protein
MNYQILLDLVTHRLHPSRRAFRRPLPGSKREKATFLRRTNRDIVTFLSYIAACPPFLSSCLQGLLSAQVLRLIGVCRFLSQHLTTSPVESNHRQASGVMNASQQGPSAEIDLAEFREWQR